MEVLKQGRNSPVTVGCQVAIIFAVINGYLDNVPVKKVRDYEAWLYDRLLHVETALHDRLDEGFFEDEDKKALSALLTQWQG